MFRWCDCNALLCVMCDIIFEKIAYPFYVTVIAILKKNAVVYRTVWTGLLKEKLNWATAHKKQVKWVIILSTLPPPSRVISSSAARPLASEAENPGRCDMTYNWTTHGNSCLHRSKELMNIVCVRWRRLKVHGFYLVRVNIITTCSGTVC